MGHRPWHGRSAGGRTYFTTRLRIGGDAAFAKLAHTALPNTGWSGYIEWANSIDDYREYAHQAAANDLRVHTVVGDQLPYVLSVLEEIDRTRPLAGRRWVLEHVSRVGPDDIERILALGLEIEAIPVFMLWKDTDQFLDDDDGEDLLPLRAMLDARVPVCADTDNVPPTPFWPMISRIERATGRVRGPGQQIGRVEALRLMTANAARLSFDENSKGTLEPGKFADVAVLSADYLTIPEDDIRSLRSVLTIVGGRIVHHEPWE